jgi:FixJ family two-component response regulator
MPRLQLHPSVFLVDDDDFVTSSLVTLLRLQGGFSARLFYEPREALEAARLEAPDLFISDVRMPHLSGIDLATQVRKCSPHCKVLLFSRRPSIAQFLESAKENGNDFELLRIPVQVADLLITIRTLTESISSTPSAEETQS